MGIFSGLGENPNARAMGLMSMGQNLMQAGAPSLQPTSTGSALMGGMNAFNQAYQQDLLRQQQEAEDAASADQAAQDGQTGWFGDMDYQQLLELFNSGQQPGMNMVPPMMRGAGYGGY